jgi:RNase P/RNase MRP subunit p29
VFPFWNRVPATIARTLKNAGELGKAEAEDPGGLGVLEPQDQAVLAARADRADRVVLLGAEVRVVLGLQAQELRVLGRRGRVLQETARRVLERRVREQLAQARLGLIEQETVQSVQALWKCEKLCS